MSLHTHDPALLIVHSRKDALEAIGVVASSAHKDAFSIENEAYKTSSSLVRLLIFLQNPIMLVYFDSLC